MVNNFRHFSLYSSEGSTVKNYLLATIAESPLAFHTIRPRNVSLVDPSDPPPTPFGILASLTPAALLLLFVKWRKKH